jgi:hypothetical protein
MHYRQCKPRKQVEHSRRESTMSQNEPFLPLQSAPETPAKRLKTLAKRYQTAIKTMRNGIKKNHPHEKYPHFCVTVTQQNADCPPYFFSSAHLHICTSNHPHICTSNHPHIRTSAYPHICTSNKGVPALVEARAGHPFIRLQALSAADTQSPREAGIHCCP